MNIPLCVSERLCLERDNCVRRYNQLVLKNHFFCMLLRIGMKPIFVMGWGLGVTDTKTDVIYSEKPQVSRYQILTKTRNRYAGVLLMFRFCQIHHIRKKYKSWRKRHMETNLAQGFNINISRKIKSKMETQ